MLLEKEVLTRFVLGSTVSGIAMLISFRLDSEDMISLLGKRPFVGRSDDMDKWLDENKGTHERSAPPPFEAEPAATAGEQTPATKTDEQTPVAAATKTDEPTPVAAATKTEGQP